MSIFEVFNKGKLLKSMQRYSALSPDFLMESIKCSVVRGPSETFGYSVSCDCLDESYRGFGSDKSFSLLSEVGFPNQSSAYGRLSEEVFNAAKTFLNSKFFLRYQGQCFIFSHDEGDWRSDSPRLFRCNTCGKEKTLQAFWFWEDQSLIPACECRSPMKRILVL